jgi:hypothetical protein
VKKFALFLFALVAVLFVTADASAFGRRVVFVNRPAVVFTPGVAVVGANNAVFATGFNKFGFNAFGGSVAGFNSIGFNSVGFGRVVTIPVRDAFGNVIGFQRVIR